MFGISYDDPETTPPEQIRYDACLRVEDDVEPEKDIGLKEIAGGTYVVAIHEGPDFDFNLPLCRLLPVHSMGMPGRSVF